jgi:hypothetical protein
MGLEYHTRIFLSREVLKSRLEVVSGLGIYRVFMLRRKESIPLDSIKLKLGVDIVFFRDYY